MQYIDFSRSFLTFRIDADAKPPRTVTHKPPFRVNNARIQLECVCRVTHKPNSTTETFYLGASCKTERVGVERDIWTEPNADFAPIFSATRFLTLKTYARVGIEVPLYSSDQTPGPLQPDRQTGAVEDTFADLRFQVTERPGRSLQAPEEIVERVLANTPLMARTHLESDAYEVTIDYPVKTINANERDVIYQTDTGPVLLPDLAVPPERLLESCELAFAAFNAPNWTEFLVRVPTPLDNGLRVYHYSRPLRLDARNELIEAVASQSSHHAPV